MQRRRLTPWITAAVLLFALSFDASPIAAQASTTPGDTLLVTLALRGPVDTLQVRLEKGGQYRVLLWPASAQLQAATPDGHATAFAARTREGDRRQSHPRRTLPAAVGRLPRHRHLDARIPERARRALGRPQAGRHPPGRARPRLGHRAQRRGRDLLGVQYDRWLSRRGRHGHRRVPAGREQRSLQRLPRLRHPGALGRGRIPDLVLPRTPVPIPHGPRPWPSLRPARHAADRPGTPGTARRGPEPAWPRASMLAYHLDDRPGARGWRMTVQVYGALIGNTDQAQKPTFVSGALGLSWIP